MKFDQKNYYKKQSLINYLDNKNFTDVRFFDGEGLEPPCHEALDPKSSVSSTSPHPQRIANISNIT